MSGIGGSEFLLLCLIGLLILGPERLPRVARQIGGWVGKARQMTRSLQRQLEDEIDVEKNLGINPNDLNPQEMLAPRDDDTYSPLHDEDDEADKTEAETLADNETEPEALEDDSDVAMDEDQPGEKTA